MSFIGAVKMGLGYKPGYFLAHEDCKRETVQVAQNHPQVITLENGAKYVPAGAIVPSNDGNAKGILYEDVDVSEGAMPGSLVVEGVVYEDKLPAAIAGAAKTAMTGIKVIAAEPAITRPY